MGDLFIVITLYLMVAYELVKGYNVGSMDHSGSCTYNFQVWTPNEDIINRIQLLESRYDNVTANIKLDVSELRRTMQSQSLVTNNLTGYFEKQKLHYKFDEVKLEAGLKNLRLEIMENKGESAKIWAFLNQIQSSIIKGVMSNHNNVVAVPLDAKDDGNAVELPTIIAQLKNGVGDLKAEWLLIKREVKDIKTGSSKIKTNIDVMEEDTVTLKSALDSVKADVKKIEDGYKSLNKTLESLKGKVGNGGNKDESALNDPDWSQFPYDDELYDQIDQLKTQYAVLQEAVANITSQREEIEVPKDCHDIYKQGFHTSGVYQIKTKKSDQFDNVYCDMINKTGWTVLQRRQDGLISFSKRWREYKLGFGNLYGEFWLGNEFMHKLTNQSDYILRVDMTDWDGNQSYAEYRSFKIGDEESNYKLKLAGFTGNAGDSLDIHDGMAFSTEDRDHDHNVINCAYQYKGGWWFNSCFSSNLNGIYHEGGYGQGNLHPYSDGITWFKLRKTEYYSLKKAEMKIRPLIL